MVNSTLLRGSEILKPFKNSLIFTPGSLARIWNRFDSGKGRALHLKIDGGVTVRRAWASMPEPLTDS
jgi:hypothetical protein